MESLEAYKHIHRTGKTVDGGKCKAMNGARQLHLVLEHRLSILYVSANIICDRQVVVVCANYGNVTG